MTTVFDFQPSNAAPFQFSPTLDGNIYNAVITWNVFGKRWYINLYTLAGGLVFCLPLIGSTVGFTLQTLSWANRVVTATVEAEITKEHQVGETLDLTITGVTPSGYNGRVAALVTSPNSFTFPLDVYPGPVVYPGSASQIVNLCAGYFSDSTLVYREANRQFEVNP